MNAPRSGPMDMAQHSAAVAQIHMDGEINLGRSFRTLWRAKWAICMAVCAALGAAFLFLTFFSVPLYRATAVVILETSQDQIVDLQSVASGLTGDHTEINSELEVLRARGLIGKVVDRLNLTQDPEFNARLREPSTIDSMKRQLVSHLPVSIQPFLQRTAAPDPHLRDTVISAVLSQIRVQNVRNSLVFKITVTSQNADKAAMIADTLVQAYIRNQIDVKFEATDQATIWLTDRVAELQARLEEAERNVSDFNAATQLVSAEALRALERQLKDLRDRINAASIDRDTLALQISAIQQAGTRLDVARLSDDQILSKLLTRADTDTDKAALFDTRADTVLAELQRDLTRADRQIDVLQTSATDLDTQIDGQGQDLIRLQQLTREAEATRLLYEYFLTRLNETAAQQGIQQADSRILSNAVVPRAPAEPRKGQILIMSALVGGLLAAGFVLVREMRRSGFRTAPELEAATGCMVVGQIPVIPARTRRGTLTYLREKPKSAAAEAVRNLRTSLMMTGAIPPQVIVSTSSVPDEGKTTNTLGLAHHLTGLGKRVILIEGDIRRQTLKQFFDVVPQKGLVSLLCGECRLSEAIFRPPGFGADLLTGEPSGMNAADLFASTRFDELIAQLRDQYDTILIDTPPVLVVPDARIITRLADTVMFSVRWDRTTQAQLDEALRLLRLTGQPPTGMVLSRINPRGMRRYGYGATSGAYAPFGAKYYVT